MVRNDRWSALTKRSMIPCPCQHGRYTRQEQTRRHHHRPPARPTHTQCLVCILIISFNVGLLLAHAERNGQFLFANIVFLVLRPFPLAMAADRVRGPWKIFFLPLVAFFVSCFPGSWRVAGDCDVSIINTTCAVSVSSGRADILYFVFQRSYLTFAQSRPAWVRFLAACYQPGERDQGCPWGKTSGPILCYLHTPGGSILSLCRHYWPTCFGCVSRNGLLSRPHRANHSSVD